MGRGKEPFLQKVFSSSPSTDPYWEQSVIKSGWNFFEVFFSILVDKMQFAHKSYGGTPTVGSTPEEHFFPPTPAESSAPEYPA